MQKHNKQRQVMNKVVCINCGDDAFLLKTNKGYYYYDCPACGENFSLREVDELNEKLYD